jgi:hypothetical protein
MTSVIEPLCAQLALLVAGLGALRFAGAIGPVSLREMAAAGGMAYLVGVALVMVTCVLLLVLGLPFRLATVAVVCAVAASPLLRDLPHVVRHRRALRFPRPRRPSTDEGLVLLGTCGHARPA